MGGIGSGRKPRPTEVKELAGERKDRVNPNPAQFDKLTGSQPPNDLNVYGREVWEIWAPQLIRSGVLTTADLPAFRILCEAFGEYRMAVDSLETEGYIITQYNKDSTREVVNPWQRIKNDAEAKIARYMARFGLTPADRAGLVLPEPPNNGNRDDPGRFLE
jgi:P27 family predicted phage terminase small subunit